MTDVNDKERQFLSELASALEPLFEIVASCDFSLAEFERVANDTYKKVQERSEANTDTRESAGRSPHPEPSSSQKLSSNVDETTQEKPSASSKMDLARLLHFWHTDPDYVGNDGTPNSLSFSGSGPNFQKLAKKYANQWPAAALLKILIQEGAVDCDVSDRFVPKMYTFIPERNIGMMISTEVRQHLSTLARNNRPDVEEAQRFADRHVFARVPNSMLARVRKSFNRKVVEFVEQINRDLAKTEMAGAGLPPTSTTLIGISAFVFED